jgi:prepilin-type N-terminal cleavage/methylation domain-containing protein
MTCLSLSQPLPRAKRRGVTLVELTLALALAAVVVMVGLRMYSAARHNSQVRTLSEQLSQVYSATIAAAGNSHNFASLETATIAKNLPPTMVATDPSNSQDVSIVTAFPGATIYVSAGIRVVGIGGAGQPYSNRWQIGVQGIDAETCTRVAGLFNDMKDLNQVSIYTNDGDYLGDFETLGANGALSLPTPSDIAGMCSPASNTPAVPLAVTYYFQN